MGPYAAKLEGVPHPPFNAKKVTETKGHIDAIEPMIVSPEEIGAVPAIGVGPGVLENACPSHVIDTAISKEVTNCT